MNYLSDQVLYVYIKKFLNLLLNFKVMKAFGHV